MYVKFAKAVTTLSQVKEDPKTKDEAKVPEATTEDTKEDGKDKTDDTTKEKEKEKEEEEVKEEEKEEEKEVGRRDPTVAGLTESRCPGVRSTLQTPLGSLKSLRGSPRGSLENLEKFSKIRTLFHRNISPMLLDFFL